MSWGVRRFSDGRQWYRTDRWQRLRRRVLSEQPFCAIREQRERCRPVATEVDHIKPHRGDYSSIERTSNRCAGVATRKRLRGRFSARDEERTNTACRSIPITTGTRRTERCHPTAKARPGVNSGTDQTAATRTCDQRIQARISGHRRRCALRPANTPTCRSAMPVSPS